MKVWIPIIVPGFSVSSSSLTWGWGVKGQQKYPFSLTFSKITSLFSEFSDRALFTIPEEGNQSEKELRRVFWPLRRREPIQH